MKIAEGYSEVFRAKCIAEFVLEEITLCVYENGIVHVKVHEFKSITKEAFEKSKVFLRANGSDRKYHFIFEFKNFADVDPDMRKKRASASGTEFSLSDAMVISNLPQKIIADFYMNFHKPVRPTKFFFSMKKAAQWTFDQMK